MAPCLRTTGTREHKRFLSSLYEAIESQYPNWRTQKAAEHNETSSAIGHQIDVIMGVPSNNSTGGKMYYIISEFIRIDPGNEKQLIPRNRYIEKV